MLSFLAVSIRFFFIRFLTGRIALHPDDVPSAPFFIVDESNLLPSVMSYPDVRWNLAKGGLAGPSSSQPRTSALISLYPLQDYIYGLSPSSNIPFVFLRRLFHPFTWLYGRFSSGSTQPFPPDDFSSEKRPPKSRSFFSIRSTFRLVLLAPSGESRFISFCKFKDGFLCTSRDPLRLKMDHFFRRPFGTGEVARLSPLARRPISLIPFEASEWRFRRTTRLESELETLAHQGVLTIFFSSFCWMLEILNRPLSPSYLEIA